MNWFTVICRVGIYKYHFQMTEILNLGEVSIIVPAIPLNSREDGGHLSVEPHREFVDRSEAIAVEAIQLMVGSMLAGSALLNVINVVKVNYQDMGNRKSKRKTARPCIWAF